MSELLPAIFVEGLKETGLKGKQSFLIPQNLQLYFQ